MKKDGGVSCPQCQQMLAVCVSGYFVGNQATVHTCACEQCHQLLRAEDSWSSASAREGGGGWGRITKKGVS